MERFDDWVPLVFTFASWRVVCGLFGFFRSLSEPGALRPWLLATLLCSLVYLGASVVLARAARQDSRALSLAGFFLIKASSASSHFQSPLRTILSGWWPAVLPGSFPARGLLPLPAVEVDPRVPARLAVGPLEPAPWSKAAVRTSGVLGLVLFLVNAFVELADLESWSRWKLLYDSSPGLFLACLPVPFVAWKRSRRGKQR